MYPSDLLPAPRRPRSRLRVAAWIVGVLAAFFAVMAVLSIPPALAIKRHFDRGKELLTKAQDALLDERLPEAADAFAGARKEFEEAEGHPLAFALRVDGVLPFVGRSGDALLSLARIGDDVATAGEVVAARAEQLPNGFASLGLTGGRIPIDRVEALAPALEEAAADVRDAARLADALPESWVLPQVAKARDVVRDRLRKVAPLAEGGAAFVRALPEFAGQNGPRRYFVGAQNTSELRGTGGIIGNYAILTIDHGKLSLSPFRDVELLANVPPERAASPSREFTDLYGPFGGGGFWLNVNMTPDAPTAASLVERLYQQVTGEHVDGTLFFDLQALADLLEATGPVKVEKIGRTVDAHNVIQFVANGLYLDPDLRFPFSEGPKIVGEAVWTSFIGGVEPKAALTALVDAAAGGHIVLHSADPKVQAAFEAAGVAGGFDPLEGDGDFASVVLTNAGANKVDYFLRERVSYDVTLAGDNRATATMSVALENRAPKNAPPNFGLGPSRRSKEAGLDLKPGESRSWTQLYCSEGCTLRRAQVDGEPLPLELHHEKGLPVWTNFVNVLPQQTKDVSLSTDLRDVWSGDGAIGEYRLRLFGQDLLTPPSYTVTIHAPAGMRIVSSNVPMSIDGGTATWSGSVSGTRDLEVRFQRGYFGRIWARVWGFLKKPV